MRNSMLMILFLIGGLCLAHGQSIVGKWKTFDDQTGDAKSIVEILEKDGKYHGKVVEILNPAKKDSKCENCPGTDKGKPIEGLTIIKNLTKKGAEYTGGTIIDPQSGKEYKCSIKTNGTTKLEVRGYVGISLIGRTQTWTKM
ncbi:MULTISPECIES: DUF2147 domain-containing protein [unclassified Myroides]|uniref:DUF2147 domain-containing protein n=1 Tax=unclassified Myroides TaxID=2642485 RepID=UPI0015F80DAD|nr:MULTISPECIES: DUF2147 domain-containing protein [unclassified Myroides]MBB1150387.1 DUF2147 domain-containing protein [Myroides sp. NP-2]MDM1407373.1 DUF2147 domain-containing protein [Myroides sp. DF42-4-2]